MQERKCTFRIFSIIDLVIGMVYAISYAGLYGSFGPWMNDTIEACLGGNPPYDGFFFLPGVIAALFICNAISLGKVCKTIKEREPLIGCPMSIGDLAAAEKHLSCNIVGNTVAAVVYFLYRLLNIRAYINGGWKEYLVPAAIILVAILLEKLSQVLFIMNFKKSLR